MARSEKHTKQFAYKRHIEHFDELNEAGAFIRKLRNKGVTQIMSIKNLTVQLKRGRTASKHQVRYYTRKLVGDKA